MNPQLRFDLQKITKEYVPTVLALMFLLQVKVLFQLNCIVTKTIFFPSQTGEITLFMADTVLVAQYHIQEMGFEVHEIPTEISNIRTESVRIGHMFNRINTLIWDCLMVCGLEAFIVRFSS